MANKSYQVTLDEDWSPNCIVEACYQCKDIASSTDFLVIMPYDEYTLVPNDPFCMGPSTSILIPSAN